MKKGTALLIAVQPDMGSVLVYFALVMVLFREGLSPYLFITGILAVILFIVTLLVSSVIIYGVLIVLAILLYLIISKDLIRVLKGVVVAGIIGVFVYSIFRWGFDFLRMETNERNE